MVKFLSMESTGYSNNYDFSITKNTIRLSKTFLEAHQISSKSFNIGFEKELVLQFSNSGIELKDSNTGSLYCHSKRIVKEFEKNGVPFSKLSGKYKLVKKNDYYVGEKI